MSCGSSATLTSNDEEKLLNYSHFSLFCIIFIMLVVFEGCLVGDRNESRCFAIFTRVMNEKKLVSD